MTAKLQALLMLQEMDALLDDMEEGASRGMETALGFPLGSTKDLRAQRESLVRKIGPELLDRYVLLRRRNRRAVAPVRHGACLGCFTVRPTSSSIQSGLLDTCERCGRILFLAEQ